MSQVRAQKKVLQCFSVQCTLGLKVFKAGSGFPLVFCLIGAYRNTTAVGSELSHCWLESVLHKWGLVNMTQEGEEAGANG